MRRSLFFEDRQRLHIRMRASLTVENALTRALHRLDSSDTELAYDSGVSRSRINRIKNGHVEPTLFDALAISAALKMRVSDLFVIAHRRPRRGGTE